MSDLPEERRDATAVVCPGGLYVMAGRGRNSQTLVSVIRLNVAPRASACSPPSLSPLRPITRGKVTPLPKGSRYNTATVALRDSFIVGGGGFVL